jgi:ABC-type multidrug transport system ATPase subunit
VPVRPGALRLEAVHKRYGRAPEVLAGVDLAVAPREIVVVAGPNGSGKSTLLRIAAGSSRPTSGRVRGRAPVVGYLPDRFPAQLRMPAAVYLRHLAALHRENAAAATESAGELLEALGFVGSTRTPMSGLSKGNAQKIGLAQALCCSAGLLVLDEPWSGLDAPAAQVLLGRVAAAAQDGASVLVTDHTGTAAALPRARHLRLQGGELRPSPPQPNGPAPLVVVELWCPLDPAEAAAALAPFVRAAPAGDRLVLHVPVGRSDALLRAALDLGCSILSVTPAARDAPR